MQLQIAQYRNTAQLDSVFLEFRKFRRFISSRYNTSFTVQMAAEIFKNLYIFAIAYAISKPSR